MNEQISNNTEIREMGSAIPARAMVMQTLSGLIFSMAIKAALEVGVFHALKDGITALDKMATSLKLDPTALKRLLRALCSVGLLHEDDLNQYSVTKAGSTLQAGATPESLEPIARYLLSELIILPMSEMSYSIRTGKPSFDKVMGRSWYEENSKENCKELSIMDKAMEAYSKISLPDILEAYPFTEYNLIVDIAGGMGQMLVGILDLNKKAKGILFDTPETIKRAKDYIKSIGFSEKCQLIPGDMFEKVPVGGDLYIISKALNDWDDEHVIYALKNVRTAMSKNSKLILIEQLANEEISSPEEAIRNLIFLVCTPGGSVRTQIEFTKLINQAGLKTSQVMATKSGFSVIECTA